VLESVLDGFPGANISASIVWIDMLPGDDAERAGQTGAMFTDQRVRQYHDPHDRRLAGQAFGAAMLYPNKGPAWDIYMFFNPEATWTDRPPRPAEWMHQLSGGRRADPSRYHVGEDLIKQLREAMVRMMARSTEKRAGTSG